MPSKKADKIVGTIGGNLHIHDTVEHRETKYLGRISGFANDGTTDVMVNGTGPYPQADFIKLVREP